MKLGFVLVCMVALVGCTGPQLPLAKDQPIPPQAGDIVRPPWEAFVKAGKGAENEIDLETLNGPIQVAEAPQATAEPDNASAPRVEAPTAPLPTPDKVVAENATPAKPSAPKAAKPARKGQAEISAVAVLPVTGAKGAGNGELTNAMRKALSAAGWPVLGSPAKYALTIRGTVVLSPQAGNSQVVKLAWVVLTPDGKSLGDVKQQNAVAAGSLDGGWGQNADFAAQAAAEGLFKLIQKYR
jgi:hypothetical protein